MRTFNFSGIQQLGRALMLPIAVLPAAALLLRFGQEDLLNLAFMASAGAAIFDNLGILFAVGIAVGFAKENNGAAGLAGVVGYFVIVKGAGVLLSVPPDIAADAVARAGYLAREASRMSIPVGILSGLTAGVLYNRYYAVKLPDYLSFFGGRRFVPIVTGFVCLGWALLFGECWPVLSAGLDGFSNLLSESGKLGLFLYGILNRLLIVTGLHHILNNVVWFLHGSFSIVQDGANLVITGDLNRFSRGDPTAGAFMAGFFPVMMFGLPAACLAMYRSALPENRRAVGGLLLSMALTAFLTGITEPVEFAFMFLAPPLYALHAVLTGLSLVIMDMLNVKLGFGFSAGFIDYAINYSKSTNPLLLVPVGAVYFVLYYGLFSICIRKFNLATIGRDAPSETDTAPLSAHSGSLASDEQGAATGGAAENRQAAHTTGIAAEHAAAGAAAVPAASAPAQAAAAAPAKDPEKTAPDSESVALIAALGGKDNIESVDACATRLRLVLKDNKLADEAALKKLGAHGVIRPDSKVLQVVFGPRADTISSALQETLKAHG
ncbi:PTS transporter subunit EIIC [Desulfovibrio sp. OttesenSCG-928-G15]|nr:PTS transporter subunit EIIC [Desulfovibrio sp. OttesenSCG-928-G15]